MQSSHVDLFLIAGSNIVDPFPIDVRLMRQLWTPDVEIKNLKEFKTLKVLSKVKYGISLFRR